MTWADRPTIEPGAYPDGLDMELILDQISFLTSPPRCQLRQTTLQTLTTGVFAPVTFTTEDEDNYNGHSTATNTSRYTAVVAGWYQCSGKVGFAGNATGQRVIGWYVDGTLDGSQVTYDVDSASTVQLPAQSKLIFLGIGNYVEIHAFQSSGGNLNTDVAFQSVQSTMTVAWHGAA